jgi:hypothetical protein
MERFEMPLHQQFQIQSYKNIIDKAEPEELRQIASALVEQFITYQEITRHLLKHEWGIDSPCLPDTPKPQQDNSELLMLKAFRQSAMRFVEHLEGPMTAEEYMVALTPQLNNLSNLERGQLRTSIQLILFRILSHESVTSLKYYDKAIKEC